MARHNLVAVFQDAGASGLHHEDSIFQDAWNHSAFNHPGLPEIYRDYCDSDLEDELPLTNLMLHSYSFHSSDFSLPNIPVTTDTSSSQ
jgi:hypothetical protein